MTQASMGPRGRRAIAAARAAHADRAGRREAACPDRAARAALEDRPAARQTRASRDRSRRAGQFRQAVALVSMAVMELQSRLLEARVGNPARTRARVTRSKESS